MDIKVLQSALIRSTGFLPKAVFHKAKRVVKRCPTQSGPKDIKPSKLIQ